MTWSASFERISERIILPYSARIKCHQPVLFFRWIQFMPSRRCTTRTPRRFARHNPARLRVPPMTRTVWYGVSARSDDIPIPRCSSPDTSLPRNETIPPTPVILGIKQILAFERLLAITQTYTSGRYTRPNFILTGGFQQDCVRTNYTPTSDPENACLA